MNTTELLGLKEKLESQSAERNRIEGEIRALEKQMKESYGSSDPEVLREKAKKLRAEASRLRGIVEEGMKKIEEKMS